MKYDMFYLFVYWLTLFPAFAVLRRAARLATGSLA
jgi:hypothetical protein